MHIELISCLPESHGVGRTPHLLFVHGGFHGAWCWEEHFLPWFAAQGRPSHALSLRGHGGSDGAERIQDWSLDDYASDVRNAIERIGQPVVLIGHSMGGVIAERVWHGDPAIEGLVFFAASPLRPSPRVIFRLLRTRPLSVLLGQMGNLNRLRHGMEPFFLSPELPEKDRKRHIARLSLESPRAIAEIFPRKHHPIRDGESRPVLVIGGLQDWSIPQTAHEDLARHYGAPLEMCPGAHGLMLDPHWQNSARAIERWLSESFAD